MPDREDMLHKLCETSITYLGFNDALYGAVKTQDCGWLALYDTEEYIRILAEDMDGYEDARLLLATNVFQDEILNLDNGKKTPVFPTGFDEGCIEYQEIIQELRVGELAHKDVGFFRSFI
jgi:hypothetical protein